RDDFEGWILRGGADQADIAFFHVGKEGILLGFVEAVDFINKDDGSSAILAGAFGVSHDLLDFFNACQYGGKLNEVSLGHPRNDLRQSGLARPGRPPEDQRTNIVALNLRAQGLAGRYQLFLAHELVERSRTHAVGERTGAIA